MFQTRRILSGGLLQGLKFGEKKNDFFTSLWNKPQTRDERVKEYVPEVIEESLEEQRAVLEESTSRDIIVELGNKILTEIDNKSPTPSIAPPLSKLMLEYGAKDVIAQRPLSYLLYPTSQAMSGGEVPHDLVLNFADNFRTMIEEIERNGCSATKGHTAKPEPVTKVGEHEGTPAPATEENRVIMASKEEYEKMDVTMFVKVASGMALANLHCGDLRNAVRCVDAGIAHAVEPKRIGGLLALKAGLLVQQKKLAEAAECAQLAVEASGNIQGYLHGAYALRQLGKPVEAVALLEKAKEDHPMNLDVTRQLELIHAEMKTALPASSMGEASKQPLERLSEK